MTSSKHVTHAQKALLKERINKLVDALSSGVYEREHTIKLCLLAALAGESVFLLGPPGIAKSLIAKRLIQAFDNSSYFEYLMTRFSTPEEVFGPLSIQELKDNGKYLRLTQGYLPTAQVVFLDEIWKAGPAILNTLLTVVNEKTFKNGDSVAKVPMRLLVSASNELPDEESGLEALYDRMLVRVFVNRIQSKQNFKAMLTGGSEQVQVVPAELAIKDEEYHHWLSELDKLELSHSCFDKLFQLKTMLEEKAEASDNLITQSDLYISDRRWKKAVKLLKASAFFNGRDTITPLDLLLLENCLWHSPESYQVVQQVMEAFAVKHAFEQQSIEHELEACQQEFAGIQAELEENLAITVTQAATESRTPVGRLASVKKTEYHYNLVEGKTYTIGASQGLYKLVMLDNIMTTDESESGEIRWIYISKKELEKVLQKGGGESYGYINQDRNMCRIRFAINGNDKLVIKDAANRPVLVGLASEKGLTSQLNAELCTKVEMALDKLSHAESHLRESRSEFHSGLPHSFVNSDLPLKIESSLQALLEELENAKQSSQQLAFRVRSMNQFLE